MESGGDNLAATFSPELVDATIYVIDVAEGDKIPEKWAGHHALRPARHQQDRPRAVRRGRSGRDGAGRPAHERRAAVCLHQPPRRRRGPDRRRLDTSRAPVRVLSRPRASAATASSCSRSSSAAVACSSSPVMPLQALEVMELPRRAQPSCSSTLLAGWWGATGWRRACGSGRAPASASPRPRRRACTGARAAGGAALCRRGGARRLSRVRTRPPDPVAGRAARQSTEIALGAGASALVWDAWSAGRPARGEAWAFAELDLGWASATAAVPSFTSARGSRAMRSGAGSAAPRAWGMRGCFSRSPRAAGTGKLSRAGLQADVGFGPLGARVGVTALGRGGVLARCWRPPRPP